MSLEDKKYYCLNCDASVPIGMYIDKNHNQDHFVVVSAENYNKKVDDLEDRILVLEDLIERVEKLEKESSDREIYSK